MMTDHEQDRALMEAHQVAAADAYFKARPVLDFRDVRRAFEAGYAKAWADRAALDSDAERFRMLCEDHESPIVRERVRDIIRRLPVMSLSAARQAIDDVQTWIPSPGQGGQTP